MFEMKVMWVECGAGWLLLHQRLGSFFLHRMATVGRGDSFLCVATYLDER